MSDLFQDEVPIDYIAQVGETMRQADQHIYQVLTKRHGRMRELLSGELTWMAELDQVWWGVSVEDRQYGLPRVEALLATPTENRWLSIEPLLEDLRDIDLTGIEWVVVGGESGPGARPMEEAWVLNILGQCREQGVPFFFKQWGGVRKKAAGRELQGQTYDEYPPAMMLGRTTDAEPRNEAAQRVPFDPPDTVEPGRMS